MHMLHGRHSIDSLSITGAAQTGSSCSLPQRAIECKFGLLGGLWWAPFQLHIPFPLSFAWPFPFFLYFALWLHTGL